MVRSDLRKNYEYYKSTLEKVIKRLFYSFDEEEEVGDDDTRQNMLFNLDSNRH